MGRHSATDGPTGIMAKGDREFTYGPFRDRETAVFYANAEFGPGNYNLVS